MIEGILEVLSPLHIGSGHNVSVEGVDGEVAGVVCDGNGNPCIPGSTLKGVLRRCAQAEPLFGPKEIRSTADARSGGCIFHTAFLDGAASGRLPHADKHAGGTQTLGQAGLFVETRTAIDPKTGTADDARLFSQQMVVPGTTFRMRLSLSADHDGLPGQLLHVLACLATTEGLPFGHGTKQGQGRMRLRAETLTAHGRVPAAMGEAATDTFWRNGVAACAAARPEGATRVIRLESTVPFLIRDSSRVGNQKRDGAALFPLTDKTGENARLTGSTLLGALRTRAVWLKRREDPGYEDRPDEPLGPDDKLTVTERLFGRPGWRGMLVVDKIEPVAAGARMKTVTSVKLDRFSSAPIDNALFATEAEIGSEFRVTLRLEPRQGGPSAEDCCLLLTLLEDLTDPDFGGLFLGHGTNKGFGWFTVQCEDRHAVS